MKQQEAMILVALVLLVATMVVIGFMAADTTTLDEPSGLMTGGDDHTPPCGLVAIQADDIPWDDVIYISAYPDEDCAPEDRVMIDTPIRVTDTDGTVYYHWFYENQSRNT